MKIFDYSTKTKIISIGVLVVLIGFLIFLISYNNSRGRDLETVIQAQSLATGLERYFDKIYAYPESSKIDLSDIKIITEKGINQTGDYLYFKVPQPARSITLISTTERYLIEFELNNSWDLWGIDNSGGTCRISNYLQMLCQSEE